MHEFERRGGRLHVRAVTVPSRRARRRARRRVRGDRQASLSAIFPRDEARSFFRAGAQPGRAHPLRPQPFAQRLRPTRPISHHRRIARSSGSPSSAHRRACFSVVIEGAGDRQTASRECATRGRRSPSPARWSAEFVPESETLAGAGSSRPRLGRGRPLLRRAPPVAHLPSGRAVFGLGDTVNRLRPGERAGANSAPRWRTASPRDRRTGSEPLDAAWMEGWFAATGSARPPLRVQPHHADALHPPLEIVLAASRSRAVAPLHRSLRRPAATSPGWTTWRRRAASSPSAPADPGCGPARAPASPWAPGRPPSSSACAPCPRSRPSTAAPEPRPACSRPPGAPAPAPRASDPTRRCGSAASGSARRARGSLPGADAEHMKSGIALVNEGPRAQRGFAPARLSRRRPRRWAHAAVSAGSLK